MPQSKYDRFLGNGGSHPEYHFMQFPLGMGRRKNGSNSTRAVLHSPDSQLSFKTDGSSHSSRSLAVVTRVVSSGADREEIERETVSATRAALKAKLEANEREVQKRRDGIIPGIMTSAALTVVTKTSSNTSLVADGPIVRSPTKEKKSSVWEEAFQSDRKKSSSSSTAVGTIGRSEDTHSGHEAASAAAVSVPFCVSAWHNKKKLIIPIEQRIAQEVDERTNEATALGDHIIDLASAMRSANQEMQKELELKQRAKEEEEERRQAALAAEAAERAKQLMAEKAAAMAQQQRRKETRAERIERIRVEKELREREQRENQRRRLRERAAARLQMTVEALEADEELVRKVDEQQLHPNQTNTIVGLTVGGIFGNGNGIVSDSHSLGSTSNKKNEHEHEDLSAAAVEEDVGEDGLPTHRKVVHMKDNLFSGANVTNEGVRREMIALNQLEQQHQSFPEASDGIRWNDGLVPENKTGHADDDDDDDDAELEQLRKRRKLRL